MRTFACALIVTTGMVGWIGPAVAADLTAAEIKALVGGKTAYLEVTTAGAAGTAGQGVLYFAEDGTILNKTPAGPVWHGKFEFKDNTTCPAWKEKPDVSCSRWDKTGDVVSIFDAGSGQLRSKITKIAPGNAEKLAP